MTSEHQRESVQTSADFPHPAVLVTGGTGLVGRALQYVIEHEPVGSRFGRKDGEKWIFLGSKDGDLKSVDSQIPWRDMLTGVLLLPLSPFSRSFESTKAVFDKHRPTHIIHRQSSFG